MTVSLALGWWLLPLLVTVAAFAHAVLIIRRKPVRGDMPGPFKIVVAYVLLINAGVFSLAAWLGYFIWRVFVG